MPKSFESLVHDVCSHGESFKSGVIELRARGATMSFDVYCDRMALAVGTFYGVKPHKSQKGDNLTFEKDTAPHAAWKRLRQQHPGYEASQNHKPEPKAKVRTSVVASAVREASSAVVSAGMTRAEFNAFIQALRESVSFK